MNRPLVEENNTHKTGKICHGDGGQHDSRCGKVIKSRWGGGIGGTVQQKVDASGGLDLRDGSDERLVTSPSTGGSRCHLVNVRDSL